MRTPRHLCRPAPHAHRQLSPPRLAQSRNRFLRWTWLFAAVATAPLFAVAQDASPTPLLAVPPRNWAVDCANNEILVIQHPDSYLRYRYHVIDEHGDQLRDQIETPEGTVARLIQRDGRPITPEEDAVERDRLNFLLSSPSTFAHHIKSENANRKLGVSLLKLMPDAMLWSYAPNQPPLPNQPPSQTSNEPPLVVIDFKPNPKWSPPSIESEPLTGLEGRIWIDPHTRRMVRLEGDVFRPVNIGWGVVAHLYPGGSVVVTQTSVQKSQPDVPPANSSSAQSAAQPPAQPPANDQRFIVNHIVEQLTLRALMVKTVKQRLVFDTADYQPVPAMTYQQAIKLLLDTPLPTH